MNILVIGSGGREHAFAWKLRQSRHCDNLFIAPGNAGTAACGTNLSIAATDFIGLKKAVLDNKIGMVVVGPEDPLVNGIYDFFKNDEELSDISIIGPSAASARLEGSKSFAKAFMQRNGIPTAAYREFDSSNFDSGIDYIKEHSLPIVLKADGLAAGKGVLICENHETALYEFGQMIKHAKFGSAGSKVVVESFLKGIEVSVFVLTDGRSFCLLPEAKDYKRIGEGDTGLNTGGMGAVSPVPFFDETLRGKILQRIIEPTIKGFEKEEMVYKGFVFFGLMIDNGEPYVIEYNCRMGDPETEVVLPRISGDFVELLCAVDDGTLADKKPETDVRTAVTTIVVSGGYPGEYEKGKVIKGLSDARDCIVFHSGTMQKGAEAFTNGGRVLAVTAFGKDVEEAATKSREGINNLCFEGMYFRRDIGYEFSGIDKTEAK